MMRNGNGPQGTTTIENKPVQTDKSGWVLVLGGGLIFLNFLFGSGQHVAAYFAGNGEATPPKVEWAPFFGMFVALGILFVLAKTGEAGSNFAVIFLIAVWVLWLLNKPNE